MSLNYYLRSMFIYNKQKAFQSCALLYLFDENITNWLFLGINFQFYYTKPTRSLLNIHLNNYTLSTSYILKYYWYIGVIGDCIRAWN